MNALKSGCVRMILMKIARSAIGKPTLPDAPKALSEPEEQNRKQKFLEQIRIAKGD